METLKFLRTMSAAEFKEQKGITKLDIFRNEKTQRNFFAIGNEYGAVYAKYPAVPLKEPMISEVETSDGEKFFLLHNKGEHAATKLETL